MSKLAHSNQETMDEIEQRALFSRDEDGYKMSQSEAFEIIHAAGVDEIKWNSALDDEYTHWQYINIK